MGKTSSASKQKYNSRVYKQVTAQLSKELVEKWETKLKEDGIGKAEFIRNAINSYLGENTEG